MVCTAPAGTYLGFFFNTIIDDSEISAEEAPFLSALALELDESSD